jgi:hypothetical protein
MSWYAKLYRSGSNLHCCKSSTSLPYGVGLIFLPSKTAAKDRNINFNFAHGKFPELLLLHAAEGGGAGAVGPCVDEIIFK